MNSEPLIKQFATQNNAAGPKIVVKKKGQKYGQGYTDDDGQLIKAQNFRFFGFFNKNDDQSKRKPYDPKRIHNLRPEDSSKRRRLGFISGKQIFGNHIKGKQWVEQQKRRHQGGNTFDNKKQIDRKEFDEDDQVIYIEPSVAEKRLKELRRMGRPFYDEDFPPNQYSLNGPYGNNRQWAPIVWEKISNHMKKPQIFKNKAQPCDIKQGYLGDCYFLAGLAALAERPDRIFQLFLLNEINDMKYYSVKMIYRGKWRTIDLDESIPYLKNQPAFSKSTDDELWVVLLEKAWAKIYGSYKQLEGGFPEQPLHDLTGAPIKYIFLQRHSPNGEDEWKYLYEGSIRQYSMVASSPPGVDSNQSPSGIFQGHAYTFLNATEIEYNYKKERIVQLRNPWGQGEFKGRWSDKDPIWRQISTEQKKRVGFKQNTGDGIFFMSFSDFLYEFRNVAVAQINDNASYVYESYVDRFSKGVFFAVEIKHSGTYSFQVDKTPERSFTGKMQQSYKYPEALIEIGKLQGNKVNKYQGYISKRRTLYRSYDLNPGLYIASIKIQFNSSYEKDFEVVLAIYSEFVSKIRLATRDQAILFSGDRNTHWTGQKNPQQQNSTWNHMTPSPHSSFGDIQFQNRNYSFGKKQTNQSPNERQIVKPDNTIATISNENQLLSSKKKVRRIQTQHTKIETIEEDQDGQAIIKVQDNETRKQSVTLNGNVKTKTSKNQIQSTEVQLNGNTTMKKEKNVETVKLEEKLPNGKVIEKTQTRERETQMMEEDDSGSQIDEFLQYPSFNSIASQKNSPGIENDSFVRNSVSNINPKTNSAMMSRQKMAQQIYGSKEFTDRNVIRYAEPDQQEEMEVNKSGFSKK